MTRNHQSASSDVEAWGLSGGAKISPNSSRSKLNDSISCDRPEKPDESTLRPALTHKDHTSLVYFRWSTASMVVLFLIFFPFVMIWKRLNHQWTYEIVMGYQIPVLTAHAWTAFASIFFLLFQGITGPLMRFQKPANSTNRHCRVSVRNSHKVAGWVTASLIITLVSLGMQLIVQGWNDDSVPRTFKSRLSPGTATGGILALFLLIGALVAVKKKNYDVHKDLMMAMILYLLVGAGGLRWLDSIIAIGTSSEECFAPWEAYAAGAISSFIIAPALLSIIYWRVGRLGLWYNRLVVSIAPLPSVVGAIAFGVKYGNDWGCPSV